jgi:2-methylisocitrate lyase-like PEP mutase family enzyme
VLLSRTVNPEEGRAVRETVETFRRLHASGCFLLPNPWDPGSAVYLWRTGFQALATTSAGFAFSRGKPDAIGALSVEEVLAHVREIVEATPLPVNADFQNGYAADPERLAVQVRRCVQTGAAGLSIEDTSGDGTAPLYERGLAVERVGAARAAIDATGIPVVLTARCEAWLVTDLDPTRTALDRLVAFADAGADCLYAPGVVDPETIGTLVRAVAPKPVNVLVSRPVPGLTLARLAELGVRRVSVGSALSRVAWGAFVRASRTLARGDFEGLAGAASFDDLEALFGKRPSPP